MPFMKTWMDPEVAIDYKNIIIYHSYDENDFEDRLEYHYTVDELGQSGDESEFDIRDLPNYNENVEHENILKEAIDKKHIISEKILVFYEE